MKKFTFNKQFMILMFLLLNCVVSYAADENLITKQITLKLTEAGTLPNKIGSSKKDLIRNLKIIGEINGTDLRFIREMAGRDAEGNSTSGNLSVLDLSEARIVEGGDYYYKRDYKYFTTSNDIIGVYTFSGCSSLTSVNIPSSVTSIRDEAFYNCSSLTSVNIPSSVTRIGDGAFSGCSSLTSINIPSSVTEIGDWAFKGCTSLTNIDIPSSVTKIGKDTFYKCNSLTSVNIPSSVTEIGEWAFQSCSSLTNINIPSSVTRIGDGAFSGCRSLTSVNIPSSVTSIGMSVFSSCSSLTSVNIPSSVTEIRDSTFPGCSSLTSVNIPSSVTKIGKNAFQYCTSLTSINIPSSVTEIGDKAFSNCTSLTSINIPSSVTEIGDKAFSNCKGLKSIYVFSENVPTIGTGAFDGCDSKNCTLYVPNGTYDAYWLSEFSYFENIVEFDATSIHNTVATPKAQETARYAVNGQRLTAPIKGINLVKYSDGTVKKEFVK